MDRPFNGCNGVRRWHTNKNYSEGVAIIAIGARGEVAAQTSPRQINWLGTWSPWRHHHPSFYSCSASFWKETTAYLLFLFSSFFSVLGIGEMTLLELESSRDGKNGQRRTFYFILFFFTRIFHSIRKIIRRFFFEISLFFHSHFLIIFHMRMKALLLFSLLHCSA